MTERNDIYILANSYSTEAKVFHSIEEATDYTVEVGMSQTAYEEIGRIGTTIINHAFLEDEE